MKEITFSKWNEELLALFKEHVGDYPVSVVTENQQELLNKLRDSKYRRYDSGMSLERVYTMTDEEREDYEMFMSVFTLSNMTLYIHLNYPREYSTIFKLELINEEIVMIDLMLKIATLQKILDVCYDATWYDKKTLHNDFFGFSCHWSEDLCFNWITVYDSGLIECDFDS